MMKKKVKKIPKYNAGGSVLDTLLKNNPLSGNTVGSTNNNSTNNFSKFSDWKGTSANPWKDMNATQKMGAVTDAVGAIGQGLSVATSGQDVNVGTALSTAAGMAGAGMTIGGPIGAGIGAAAGLVMGTAGRKAGYDENSASTSFKDIYDPGSGWLGALSNKKAAKIGANMVQNNNIAKIQSEGIKADYANNPNVVILPNVLVAEGGIVPGEHYASRGEVEVSADGTNAVRYGWDNNGKDTYHVYTNPDGSSAAGNMVFTEEGVRRPNGEKYSDAAEKIIKGTKEGSKLRLISLKKLANEMEEQKMGKEIKKIKNGIPAHEGGKSGLLKGREELALEIEARKKLSATGFIHKRPDGVFVMLDLYGNLEKIPDHMLWGIKQADNGGYYFDFTQTGVGPSAGKWNGSMNFAKQILNSKNIAKLRNTITKVLPKGAKSATPSTVGNGVNAAQAQKEMLNNDRTFQMWQRLGNKGGVPAKTVESNVAAYRDASKASRNLWELTPAQQAAANASVEQYIYDGMVKSNLPYWSTLAGMTGGAGTFLLHEATKDKQPVAINTSASIPVNTNGLTVATTLEKPVEPVVTSTEAPTENEKKEVVVPKKSSINKPSSGKKTTTSRVTTSTVSSPEDTVVRRPVYEEPIKTVTAPVDDTKVYGRDGSVRYDYTTPERKVTPEDLGRTTNNNNNSYTGSNWRDNLYRMTVLSQPLWDRAETESVNYESPVYKYMPTLIDVSSQLRDADQSYALARYNFANLYPSTGAGMAAGLQAASNRAKQLSDIRQYQTNAQNELIGKNVGIYNNWANEHARIMNEVYNKTAANRAAARNINRQNRAAALSNYGKMLRDDKQNAVDRMKFAALKPAILSTYEDASANDIYKWYKELFG